jgi:hypothetical protein
MPPVRDLLIGHPHRERAPVSMADTPMPGEDPGALIEEDGAGNPLPPPRADPPEEDDPAVEDTEHRPT